MFWGFMTDVFSSSELSEKLFRKSGLCKLLGNFCKWVMIGQFQCIGNVRLFHSGGFVVSYS